MVRYAWTQIAGPSVHLWNANTANPSFAAPSVSAQTTLEFRLTVTDDDGATGDDSVRVTVYPTSTTNRPPVARAGSDQTVTAGARVSLSGAASSDPDGSVVRYAWTRISGPSVSLSGATTADASFTAPTVTTHTTLEFRLTVTDDDGATHQDTVRVTVRPAPDDDVLSVGAYIDGSLRISGVYSANRATGLDHVGLVIVLPGGESLSCMDGITVTVPADGCLGRRWMPNGNAEQGLYARFRDAGTYHIYFDASRSSSPATLNIADGLVDRWPRAASFDGNRTLPFEFNNRHAAAGREGVAHEDSRRQGITIWLGACSGRNLFRGIRSK